jgi:hypothetical protein
VAQTVVHAARAHIEEPGRLLPPAEAPDRDDGLLHRALSARASGTGRPTWKRKRTPAQLPRDEADQRAEGDHAGHGYKPLWMLRDCPAQSVAPVREEARQGYYQEDDCSLSRGRHSPTVAPRAADYSLPISGRWPLGDNTRDNIHHVDYV